MIIIFILSLLGFLNAFYLYYQQKKEIATGQKMFCLIGGDCDAVVGSKYGQTLGIKNELIGMTYYFLLGVYSFLSILVSQFAITVAIYANFATIIATIFSLYLLFIQAIILRKFCSWCLIAITINFLIFYLLTFSPNSLINLSILGLITNWQ